MEAVPKLPLISFELKVSPENTLFGPKLKQYIAEVYREDPESYSNEIHQLEGLRSAAIRSSTDYSGLSALNRYFCQLRSLQSRFPMAKGQPAACSFAWKDLYANMSSTLSDIRVEMASILYNIGALHTLLGSSEPRNTAESLKAACTHYQNAAWAFQHLKEQYPQPPGVDVCSDIMRVLQKICFAQAQECILEKSIQDTRKSSVIGAVATQVHLFYKNALALLGPSTGTVHEIIGTKLYNYWHRYLSFKSSYIGCIVCLYQGLHAEELQKMGERVAFYNLAADRLNEARKLAKHIEPIQVTQEALTFTNDVVEGKRKGAKNENEFIYHEEVPEKDLLTEMKPVCLVKAIPINFNDAEVSGPDIFSRLVPMGAHEASSLYSEEKAKLLRSIVAQVDAKNTELTEFMSSLQLDQLEVIDSEQKVPQEIVDRCAAMNAKTEIIQSLVDSMNNLAEIIMDVEHSLEEIQTLIQEESESEKQYQSHIGPRPNTLVQTELTRERHKYAEAHARAADSNNVLHKAMTLHIANLRLLALPLDELREKIPSLECIEGLDRSTMTEMRRVVGKAREMQTQRAALLQRFRDALNDDDITQQLLSRGNEDSQEIFKQEIEKHTAMVKIIEQNLSAQENIINKLTSLYASYGESRRLLTDVLRKRESLINALITSYDTYEELLGKAQKGMEFYKKLSHNVNQLLARVKSTCQVQEEERSQLLAKNSKPSTPTPPAGLTRAAAEVPPAAVGRKLKDYLPYMQARRRGVTPQAPMEQMHPEGYYPEAMYPTSVRPTPVGSEATDIPMQLPDGVVMPGQAQGNPYDRYSYPTSETDPYSAQNNYAYPATSKAFDKPEDYGYSPYTPQQITSQIYEHSQIYSNPYYSASPNSGTMVTDSQNSFQYQNNLNSSVSQAGVNQQINQAGINQQMNQPGINNQQMNQPNVNQQMNQPNFNQQMNQPGNNQQMNQPNINQQVNQPGINQQMNQPGNNLNQPGLGQQIMSQPGMHQQGMNQTGMNQLGTNQPNMNQPGINQLGISQPNMNQTGFNQQGNQAGTHQTGMSQANMIHSGINQSTNLPGTNQININQQGMNQAGIHQTGINQANMSQATITPNQFTYDPYSQGSQPAPDVVSPFANQTDMSASFSQMQITAPKSEPNSHIGGDYTHTYYNMQYPQAYTPNPATYSHVLQGSTTNSVTAASDYTSLNYPYSDTNYGQTNVPYSADQYYATSGFANVSQGYPTYTQADSNVTSTTSVANTVSASQPYGYTPEIDQGYTNPALSHLDAMDKPIKSHTKGEALSTMSFKQAYQFDSNVQNAQTPQGFASVQNVPTSQVIDPNQYSNDATKNQGQLQANQSTPSHVPTQPQAYTNVNNPNVQNVQAQQVFSTNEQNYQANVNYPTQGYQNHPGYTYNAATGMYEYTYGSQNAYNSAQTNVIPQEMGKDSNWSAQGVYTSAGAFSTVHSPAAGTPVQDQQMQPNQQIYYNSPYGYITNTNQAEQTTQNTQSVTTNYGANVNQSTYMQSGQGHDTSVTFANTNQVSTPKENVTEPPNFEQSQQNVSSNIGHNIQTPEQNFSVQQNESVDQTVQSQSTQNTASKQQPQEVEKSAENVPETKAEPSVYDLLSDIDFTVEHKPLMPDIKVPQISESAIKRPVIPKEEKPKKKPPPKEEVIERPAKRDLFTDPSLLNQFTQEVKNLQKLTDSLTNTTAGGLTVLDAKWKMFQEVQNKENMSRSKTISMQHSTGNIVTEVVPYDDSRLTLRFDRDAYINASYYKQLAPWCIPIIISKNPTENEHSIFWKAVLENKISCVVCLLSEIEMQGKCYWPTAKGQTLELQGVKVTLDEVNCNVHWSERKLTVASGSTVLNVMHYQINVFPAKIVSSPLVLLSDKILSHTYSEREGPQLLGAWVQCGSGAGRSALIALLVMLMCQVRAGQLNLCDMLDAGCINLIIHRSNVLEDTKYLADTYRTALFYVQGVLCSGTTMFNGEAVSVPSGAAILPPVTPHPLSSQKHKFSRESFEEMKQSPGLKSGDMKDPLNFLDPLWSLKKK